MVSGPRASASGFSSLTSMPDAASGTSGSLTTTAVGSFGAETPLGDGVLGGND
jgi:hypothetical protein